MCSELLVLPEDSSWDVSTLSGSSKPTVSQTPGRPNTHTQLYINLLNNIFTIFIYSSVLVLVVVCVGIHLPNATAPILQSNDIQEMDLSFIHVGIISPAQGIWQSWNVLHITSLLTSLNSAKFNDYNIKWHYFLFTYLYVCLWLLICMCTYLGESVWKAEGSLKWSVQFLHYVDPGDQIQFFWLVKKHPLK